MKLTSRTFWIVAIAAAFSVGVLLFVRGHGALDGLLQGKAIVTLGVLLVGGVFALLRQGWKC